MQKKLVAITAGSFGLGALISWAVTADLHQKRHISTMEGTLKIIDDKSEYIGHQAGYIQYLQGVVNELKNNTSDKEISIDPNQATLDEADEETVVNIVTEIIQPEDEEESEIPPDETPEETRSNLQKLIDDYTANPDNSEELMRIVDQAVESDKSPPFVISRETFAYDEEGEDYSKITLTYYPRDRVLLDEDEDLIDDLPTTVGWRNLSMFGGESGDPDTVFIRNRRLQTDFEVLKEEEQRLPLHIQYGMEKEEFRVNKAAGLIKLRREDE